MREHSKSNLDPPLDPAVLAMQNSITRARRGPFALPPLPPLAASPPLPLPPSTLLSQPDLGPCPVGTLCSSEKHWPNQSWRAPRFSAQRESWIARR